MDHSLVELILLFLLIAVTLNFILTIRIAAIVREAPEPQDLPFTLELEASIPNFVGKKLKGGRMFSSDSISGSASVLVFLSSTCRDCRKKIPEILFLLPAMHRAGVELLIFGMEAETRVRKFLGDTPLFEHVLMIDSNTRKKLNPRNSSPFYIFVDDQLIAKASNFIGDENWNIFIEQMREISLGQEGEAAHEI